MDTISWGIISTAKIGVEKIIPALQESRYAKVLAIASRDETRARSVAGAFSVPRTYGSYEDLLADPDT